LQINTFSTLFVGQNLIKLPSVDSTNNYLKNLLSKSAPLPEGTVIMADDQFAGRGQQSNTWHAEPGKNLTFSILLKPTFLAVNNQFLLNMAVSVAINNALTTLLPNGLAIKWPNDIYYFDQKLGGVLIENSLSGSVIKTAVIGIGINVNQVHFNPELKARATSVAQILQENVKLELLLAEICSQIESLYLRLRGGDYNFLRSTYVDKLYQYQQPTTYKCNNEVFEGTIVGVTDSGLLKVDKKGTLVQFNFKEIEFIKR
jgi:BirA family biotin operon repressor/biotin-[acetyl-CoA-carboxylase] ligase